MKSAVPELVVLKSIIKMHVDKVPQLRSLHVPPGGAVPRGSFFPGRTILSQPTLSDPDASRDSFLSGIPLCLCYAFSVLLVAPCVLCSSHVNASLGLPSPLSMLFPWEISPSRRRSLSSLYVSSHGLSRSSHLQFQLPAGFSHQSKPNMLLKPNSCLSLKTSFLFLSSFCWITCHCFKPGSHPSVFPLDMTCPLPQHHQISHTIDCVHFWRLFLKGSPPLITQPHYFLLGPLQELHRSSPQLPTNLPSTVWPEWWVYNNKTTSKHSPPGCLPSVPWAPKTQTRCVNQVYSALPHHRGPPKHIPSQPSWNSHRRSQYFTVLCPCTCNTYPYESPHNTHNMYTHTHTHLSTPHNR